MLNCRLILIVFLAGSVLAKDFFTSLGEMTSLVSTCELATTTLEGFIIEQNERIEKAKKILGDFKEMSSIGKSDPEKFIGNPVNAFLLIKQLSVDLQLFVDTLNNFEKLKSLVHDISEASSLPTSDDYTGAIKAIHRLEDTYLLNATSIRLGSLNARYPSRPLTAFECFELGRIAYYNKDYYHSIIWMTEALRQLETDETETVKRFDVLDYLSFSTSQQGNIQHAIDIAEEMLLIDPTHKRTVANLDHFRKTLNTYLKPLLGETDVEKNDLRDPREFINARPVYSEFTLNYEYLCREKQDHVFEDPRLKCRYINYNPYIYIAPVKEEQLHIDPDIWLFHDVISNSEIETMKKLAIPKLSRAIVRNPVTGEMETAEYRVSKSAWLTDDEDPVLPHLTKVVESITNLTLSTAEEWQIANYGIGGQYDPHFDFARKKEPANAFSDKIGNRIATWLFYLEAPEEGGATVFTNINARVVPIRGSAVFWHNILPSGNGDFRTRHAACPVLYGQKWVSNKWLHMVGQEFKRPCNLVNEESDEEL